MLRKIIRGEIDNTAKKLFKQNFRGELSMQEVADQLHLSIEDTEKMHSDYLKGIAEASKIHRPPREETVIGAPISKSLKQDSNEYDSGVQKMLSFKGTVRPITLTLKNPKTGAPYKMRIINLYVKPNRLIQYKNGSTKMRENTRLYEESAYSVDKASIKKGGEGYYPDKARWSKIGETAKIPQSTESSNNEEIPISDTTRKRHGVKMHIKRKLAIKRKNACKCKPFKKR